MSILMSDENTNISAIISVLSKLLVMESADRSVGFSTEQAEAHNDLVSYDHHTGAIQ